MPIGEMAVEASAPTRIDLAGGVLDGLGEVPAGAVRLSVGVDRRAWARVERIPEGVAVEAREIPARWEAPDAETLARMPGAPLAAHVMVALGIGSGLKVQTRSRVGPNTGLGGASALGVAVASALSRFVSRGSEGIAATVRKAEAAWTGSPAALGDALAALHGGILSCNLEGGEPERLRADPGKVEESILLVDSGVVLPKGVPPDRVSGIAQVAGAVRAALAGGALDEIGPLLAREWELERGGGIPEVDRIVSLVAAEGGAARPCFGGGVIVVWARPGARGPGCRERVVSALQKGEARLLPFRVDLRGLEVAEVPQKPL
jgi:galactokinase/mevalonate kinase-like predicted kinase